jgi:hypothetical protein
MDLSNLDIHSFIIKIWLEEPTESSQKRTWRGHITHVPGGERRAVKQLDEIFVFIIPYLEARGVKVNLFWRCVRFVQSQRKRSDS